MYEEEASVYKIQDNLHQATPWKPEDSKMNLFVMVFVRLRAENLWPWKFLSV